MQYADPSITNQNLEEENHSLQSTIASGNTVS